MTVAGRRILTRLLDGDALVRDRRGWHMACGVGRERLFGTLALSMLAEGWIEPADKTPERAVYRITEAARAMLEEPRCDAQTS